MSRTRALLLLGLFLVRPLAAGDDGPAGDKTAPSELDERYAARGVETAPTILPAFRLGRALGKLAIEAINGEAVQSADGISSKDDPRVVKQAEDLTRSRFRWGGLPRISFRTGAPQVGANLFFRKDRAALVGGFVIGSSKDYERSLSASWQAAAGGSRVLRLGLEALKVSDDAHRFYGIGAKPQTDPRSHFLAGTDAEYGVYQHKSSRIAGVAGLRLSRHAEVFLAGHYLEQEAVTPEDQEEPFSIDRVYDVAALPGAQAPSKQAYGEIAFNYDSRRFRGRLDPGFGLSGYVGPSIGVGGDRSRALRLGGEAVAYVPVVRNNRLLVPRLTLDTLTNLRDDVPFNFTDYPRQLPFRNVNSAITLLRQDNSVLNASVEYQWPVARSLSASLFAQAVVVGPSVRRLTVGNAPWDAGLKIELHSRDAPVLAVWAAAGRNGFYVWFQSGIVEKSNDRWRWY